MCLYDLVLCSSLSRWRALSSINLERQVAFQCVVGSPVIHRTFYPVHWPFIDKLRQRILCFSDRRCRLRLFHAKEFVGSPKTHVDNRSVQCDFLQSRYRQGAVLVLCKFTIFWGWLVSFRFFMGFFIWFACFSDNDMSFNVGAPRQSRMDMLRTER